MMIIVHPRVRIYTFQNHDRALESFLRAQAKSDGVDPRAFWEFREFYSIGHFSFPDNGQHSQERHAIGTTNFSGIMTFLKYDSHRVSSREYLVSIKDPKSTARLRPLMSEHFGTSITDDQMIFFGDRILIYTPRAQQVSLVFVAPGNQIKNTVGFLDLQSQEDAFINKSLWVSQSTFRYDGSIEQLKQKFSAESLLSFHR